MAAKQNKPQNNQHGAGSPPAEPPRGFTTAPTPEQLLPTEREAFLLDTLSKWQETSAQSRIVLGEPLAS